MSMAKPVKHSFRPDDIERLRSLVPLRTLSQEAFDALCETLEIEQLAAGQQLFAQGDTDHINFYLLEGELALFSGGREQERLQVGTEKSRFPVAHVLPRKLTAKAKTAVRVACLDSRRVSDLLARAQTSSYQVSDVSEVDTGDWMSLMLQSPVLQQVPASNIQRVMMQVEQIDVQQGQDVIVQGAPGDYYYMLIRGQALVLRDTEGNGQQLTELAQLGPGDAFGEEALLSDRPRNSTIRMQTDGQVLRLAKKDFVDLIQVPLSRTLQYAEAQHRVEQGAVWLDLRSADEYERSHMPGSLNLPLESLRYQAASLAPEHLYIVYGRSDGQAQIGAFQLTERGFDAWLLAGGADALPLPHQHPLTDPAEVEPVVEVPSSAAKPDTDVELLQAQLNEAQAQLRKLEHQRRRDLLQIKQTMEKTRQRLLASERQRLAALQAQQKVLQEKQQLAAELERVRQALAEQQRALAAAEASRQALANALQQTHPNAEGTSPLPHSNGPQ